MRVRAQDLRRDRGGAAAVEMALVAAPFLALVIACLQTGLVYLGDATLDLTAQKVGRLVLTGSAQDQNLSQSQFLAQACSKLPVLLKCSNLMVDAQVYSSFSAANITLPAITYAPDGSVSNQWSFNIGGPGDIVVIRLMYLMPVVGGPLNFLLANQPNGNRLLMSTTVLKNEPFQ